MKRNIGLAALIILVAYFGFNLTKGSRQEEVSGLTLSRNAFTFLNKTIDPKGGFFYKFNCDVEGKPCVVGEPYNPIGHAYSKMPPHFGHLILAFHDYGKKTGEKEYTDKADRAMEWVLEQCKNDIDYCKWNFSPLIVYWNETKDPRYKDAMLKAKDEIGKDYSLTDHLALNAGLKLNALYQVTGDKKYLDLLTKNADQILGGGLDQDKYALLYSEGGMGVRAIKVKAIWATIMPAYVATKDQKYLSFARDFFEKADLSSHIKNLPITDKLEFSSYALDSLWQLSTLDTDSKETYLNEAQKIGEYVYRTYADTKGGMKYDGDNGFVEGGVKDSLINGWLVRQYIRLGDKNF